ncbi:MAG: hypothetical protein IT184_03290 [Acidobacteria bacterium]|nr:hypothetical protein [Acidobacteriota bacterium]
MSLAGGVLDGGVDEAAAGVGVSLCRSGDEGSGAGEDDGGGMGLWIPRNERAST